jgi:hypothetical protein
MTRKADAIPDSPSDVKKGALTLPWGGSNWACACSAHAERPMMRYPFEPLEPHEIALLRGGKVYRLEAADPSGQYVDAATLERVVLEQGDHPLRVLPVPDGDGLIAILRHPSGVSFVPLDAVEPEDLVLAGEPVRRPNGEPIYTGEPAPGFQPDCLACSETVENLIDHMLRVEHDRKTAERFHARELRRMGRDLGIGAS